MSDIKTILITAEKHTAEVQNTPVNTEVSNSLIRASVSTKSVGTSIQDTLVNVVMSGLGEEKVPDPKLFKFIPEQPVKPTDSLFVAWIRARIFAHTARLSENILSKNTGVNKVERVKSSEQFLRVHQALRSFFDTSSNTDPLSTNVSKPVHSSLESIADTVNISQLKNASDFLTVLGLSYFATTVSPLKLETSQVTDIVNLVVEYYRSTEDLVNVTDDFLGEANIDDDQYAVFNKVLVDPAYAAEILQLSFDKVLASAAQSPDSVAHSLATIKVSAFTAQDDEFLTNYNKLVYNAVSFNDFAKVLIVLTKYLYSQAVATDQANFIISKILLENFTTTDTYTVTYSKPLVDTISQSDLSNSFVGKQLATSASILSVSSFSYTKHLINQVNNTELTSVFIDKNSLSTANTTSLYNFTYSKPLVDILNQSDLSSLFVGKQLVNSASTLSVSSFSYSKLLANQVNNTELTSVLIDKNSLSNANTTSTYTIDYTKPYTDNLSTASTVAKAVSTLKQNFVANAEVNNWSFNKGLLENVPGTDSYSVVYTKQVFNYVYPTDDFLGEANLDDDQYVVVTKTLHTDISYAESFNRAWYAQRIFQNLNSVLDNVAKTLQLSKSDSTNISDFVDVIPNKNLIENISVSNPLSLNKQNYFSEDYVVVGYAGETYSY
jgi:hypothetical protein